MPKKKELSNMMTESKPLPINEVYTCLQGEGKLIGTPSIMIRFVGCRLRCQFANSVCDTWYSSWKPEKGSWTYERIAALISENQHIKHFIITGGGPTLQKTILPQVVEFIRWRVSDSHITLETEGSEWIEWFGTRLSHRIDLLSLSPKLSNSVPVVDSFITEIGRKVTQKDVDRHNKWRSNYDAMKSWIRCGCKDYQVKPVIEDDDSLKEFEHIRVVLNIPANHCWLMPAGDVNEKLEQSRQWLEQICIERGYNYTDRLHIIIHGNKREV